MRYVIGRYEEHSRRLAALFTPPADPASMTVEELVRRYFEIRASYAADGGRALRSTTKTVLRHFGHRLMREISDADLNDYIGMRLAQNYSPITVRTEVGVIRAALKIAATRGWREEAPGPLLPSITHKETRALTPEEAQALYRAIDHPACARFVAIALATGARASAITDLTWDRVDVVRRTIDFRAPIVRASRRKGRPIVAVTDELLTLIGARVPGLIGRVIDYTPQHIGRLIRKAALDAGLGAGVSPHTLRRTVATTLVKTRSVTDAQKLLGHRVPSVTEGYYVKLNHDDLRRAIEVNAPLISVLAHLHPGPGAQRSTDYAVHITDKTTGSIVEQLAGRMGLSPPEALRLACSAALSCLERADGPSDAGACR